MKQCEVILLPTDRKSYLYLLHGKINLSLHGEISQNDGDKLPQHLYVVSNEDIKEGDWYIPNDSKIVLRRSKDGDSVINGKKIIASTDSQITSKEGILNRFNGTDKKDLYKLPQLSQEFINLYIEEYNKGNKIEKVEIEYEQYGDVPYYYIYGNCKYECKYKGDWFDLTNGEVEMSKSEEELDAIATKHYYSAFTNPDNTINIKSLKDSWNREEIKFIATRFRHHCDLNGITTNNDTCNEFDKWIKKNL